MGLLPKITWRVTMLVNGVEHALIAYIEEDGHGMTLCGIPTSPSDVGPRVDLSVTCQKCIEIRDSK
jgi:hypothetical protein